MQYAHKNFNILHYFYKEAFQTGISKVKKSMRLCGKAGRQKKWEAGNIYFIFFFFLKKKKNSLKRASHQVVKEYRLKKDSQI